MRASNKDFWIETFWFYSQNCPTVVLLFPRAIICVVLIVLFGPSASGEVAVVEDRDSSFFDSEDGRLTSFIYVILLINLGWAAWRLLVVTTSFLGLVSTLGFKAGLSREQGLGYEKEFWKDVEEGEAHHREYSSAGLSQGSRFHLMSPSNETRAGEGMWDEGNATVGAFFEEDPNLQTGTQYPPTFTPVRSRPVSGTFGSKSLSPARAWRQRAEDRIREVLYECIPSPALDRSLSRINQTLAGRESRDVSGTPRASNDVYATPKDFSKLPEEANQAAPQDSTAAPALPISNPARAVAQTDGDVQAATVARSRTRTAETDGETLGDWTRSRGRATSSPTSPTLNQRLEKVQTSGLDRKRLDEFGSPAQSSVVEMLLETPVLADRSPAGATSPSFPSDTKTEEVNSLSISRGVGASNSKLAGIFPFPSRISTGSSPRASAEGLRSNSELGRNSADRERKSSTFQRRSEDANSRRRSKLSDSNSSGGLTPNNGSSKTHSREVSAGSSAGLTIYPGQFDQQPSPLSLPSPGRSKADKPSSSLVSLASSLKKTITRSNKSSLEEKYAPVDSTLSNSSAVSPSKEGEARPTIAERRHQSNSGVAIKKEEVGDRVVPKPQGSDDWWSSVVGAFRGRSDSNPTRNTKADPLTPSQESRPDANDMSRTSTAKLAGQEDADLAAIELSPQNRSSESLEVPAVVGPNVARLTLATPETSLNRSSSPIEPPSPGGLSLESENTDASDDSEERRLWASFPSQSRLHPPGRIVADLEQQSLAARQRERARIDLSVATSSPSSSSGAMSIPIPSRPYLSSSPDSSSPMESSNGVLAPLALPSELSKSPSEGGLIPIKEEVS